MLGVVHPFLYVGRYRVVHGEGFTQYVEIFDFAVDQLLQGAALDFQVIGGFQFLRPDEVVTGLGFVGVGDGGGADFEVALGLFQLLGDGGFLGGVQLYGVLGDEDVEVGLCGAQYDVLFGQFELGFGDGDLQFGFGVGSPVLFAEQGLHQGDAVAVGVVIRRCR